MTRRRGDGQGVIDAGDDAVWFSHVYQGIGARLLSWAWSRVGHIGDAEDVVHDVMARLWERRGEIVREAWARWAWEAGIRSLLRRRRQRAHLPYDDSIEVDQVGLVGENTSPGMTAPVVGDGRDRLVIWLLYCLGLKSHEVASLLGISASAVRMIALRHRRDMGKVNGRSSP